MTIKQVVKHVILFAIGALIYGAIEIIASGKTHWSMLILGGVCFLIIGGLNEHIPWKWSITTQALAGAVVITAAELVTGCIVNLLLGWDVWSYSEKPYNLLGQICAENCFYWLLLSSVAIIIDDYIRFRLFGEEKPRYRL